MTMIAFATHADHAEIMTDTMDYLPTGERLWDDRAPKFDHVAGMLVTTQGSKIFGNWWKRVADDLAARIDGGFDAFDQAAAHALPAVWRQYVDDCDTVGNDHPIPSAVFHIGYSHDHGRYRAYGRTSLSGFERIDLDGLYIMPAPFGIRPGPIEEQTLRDAFVRHWNVDDERFELHMASAFGSAGTGQGGPPATVDGWVELACRARASRAMARVTTGLKTFVAGDVFYGCLDADGLDVARVHTFDDQGDELGRMMAGTLHPAGQAAPCLCGSGARYVDCHVDPDVPCSCRSGSRFGDCCHIDVQARTTVPA